MKWFFATNKKSITEGYGDFIKVAVLSAKKNAPSLEPYCIYDGPEDEFCEWLKSREVKVVHHRISFYDTFINSEKAKNELFMKIATGAYLRVDIPLILEKENINDNIVLYTDCDILFVNDININEIGNVSILSGGPESDLENRDHINTGVLFLNVSKIKNKYDRFVRYIKNNFLTTDVYDQDMYNEFFKGEWNHLNPEFNWKPHWGKKNTAKIIHFHGPKPGHRKAIRNKEGHIPDVFYSLASGGFDHYCDIWFDFLKEANE